ncbi:MAG: quinone-dependent dihydroorotate dehydrogenase [Parerythrobacter sp.]
MLYSLLRPAVFALDPERAHRLTIAALRRLPASARRSTQSDRLATTVAGIRFPNPVGLAAGFDKDAEVPDAMLRLGFGFTEVGSITPRPQAGNPKPRLFRLQQDGAIINRMGFNNGGAAAAKARLAARSGRPGIVGINIGANKDSPDRIADYATMARTMAPLASYLAVNISSPNTPGLRALQDEGALTALLDAVFDAVSGSGGADGPPVFLKVAPDLEPADIDDIARIAIDKGLGALIVANTTVNRPPLGSPGAHQTGGLSGAPLKDRALGCVRNFRTATGGAVPLVGVGGIASAEDAWERIRAGASLVQLYSALVYRGPGLARDIVRGLDACMTRDGFASIAEAVGTE